jgi:hypothetical protein
MSLISGAHGNTRLQLHRLTWNWDVAMGSIYGDVSSMGGGAAEIDAASNSLCGKIIRDLLESKHYYVG